MVESDRIPLAGRVRVQWADGVNFVPGEYRIQHTIPSTGRRLMVPELNGEPVRERAFWVRPKHFEKVERVA